MKRKNLQRSGIALVILGGLIWLGNRKGTERSAAETGESRTSHQGAWSGGSGDSDDSADSSLPSKTGPRLAVARAATEEEQRKFRRFFLPPLTFENASIDDAVAVVIRAYREAADATGDQALNLRVDLSSARKDLRITCTTPRSTVGPVLKLLAAKAGNSTTGTTPNFRLLAADQTRDKFGKKEVPPDFVSMISDVRKSLQLGNSSDEISLTGSTLTYKDLSAADLEMLQAMLDVSTNGGMGPTQVKANFKLIMLPESVRALDSGTMLSDQDLQMEMRRLAMTKGVDLMTMPAVTARPGENATIEIIREKPTPPNVPIEWTGVRILTSYQPLGLGQETAFHFESRDDEKGRVSIEEKMTLPENSTGIALQHLPDGRTMVVMPTATMIDATGRPISDSP